MKNEISLANRDFLFEIAGIIPITKAYIISPAHHNLYFPSKLSIACLETDDGMILGGAARDDYIKSEFKALCEALVHTLALNRYQHGGVLPVSDYEKRLVFLFKNKYVFLNRLKKRGEVTLRIPDPIVDLTIHHRLDNLCSVHKMLFSFESNINSNSTLGYI